MFLNFFKIISNFTFLTSLSVFCVLSLAVTFFYAYQTDLFFGHSKRSFDSNSLMELTELVHKGEQRGIFVDKMPATIQQAIHAENITFVKNRDVYSSDYFAFLVRLTSRNSVSVFLYASLFFCMPA